MAKLEISPSQSKPRKFTRAGGRAGKKAASFVLNTRTLQHGEILPSSTTMRGCLTKGGTKVDEEGNPIRAPSGKLLKSNGPPRPDQVELVFVPRGKAAKVGAKAGPALRFCTGTNEGRLLPVKDPRQAKKIAQKYQACVKAGGGVRARAKCLEQATGKKGLPLADLE